MKELEVKEHEDEVMSSGVISTVTINSSAVDKTGPETFDGGEGKHERVLSEKDQGEDVMVDVVGSDAIADEHVDTGANLDSNAGYKELVERSCDQDMEDVPGSGEDCDASVGTRVLASEKDEVAVNEEDGNALVESRRSSFEKVEVTANDEELGRSADVEITVASGFNGEVAVIDSLELTEKCLTKTDSGKIVESAILTADLGSKEVGTVVEKGVVEDNVFVDPSLVCVSSQRSAAEVVNSRTDEVTTDDAQEMIDGDHLVDEKIEKENAVVVSVVSSKVSEPLTTKNSGSEDADVAVVDEGSASKDEGAGEGEANVHAEDADPQVEVVKLSEKESFIPAIEVLTETAQDLAYGSGVMDKKTRSKIPELLTIVNHVPEEVNSVTPIADTVEDPVVSEMDIDEVREIDVTNGAEKDQNLKTAANSEVNVKHKLPESSSEPVLISNREEYNKSREPIVYGRRVHVEVPLYESLDVEQKLPESSSPVSDDESLKIETDTEEEEDDDDEFMQENEQASEREETEVSENGHVFSLHQPGYFGPPETEGKFSVSDLVWGKVRSHPWWPGQIIDPSSASKKAMKYYKKDCFLVAYFGDHSFAWNNPSVLKPFRSNFSQFKDQTDSEIFKIAIGCALEEVARRVELGLTCSCVPEKISKNIECQVVENGGVRKKSSKRHGKDESASASSFEPDKLMDYVRLLGQFPSQTDQMDLSIAKAQLTSYSHYKGYRDLPEFWVFGDLLEDAPANEKVDQVNKSSENFENNNPVESVIVDAPESVGGTSTPVSSSGLKKRKARASGVTVSNGSAKRRNRSSKSVSVAPSSTPKPSFKVGELIRRAASQLTGPPSASKSGGDPDDQHADHIVHDPEKPQMELSVAEMLLQLLLTAQDPMKEYSLYQAIIPFFYERRAAVFSKSLKKSPATEKPENGVKRNDEPKENVPEGNDPKVNDPKGNDSRVNDPKGNDPKVNDPKGNDSRVNDPKENDTEGLGFDFDFDFDDVNDSYWTDRIVQNGEDQPLQDSHQNGGVEECQVVELEHHSEDHPKPEKRKRNRSNKKQKPSKSKAEPKPEVEEESEVVRKRRENSATEIIMKFEEGSKFSSGIQLNKTFRRFGPLMESETEVDQAGGRARVVFKKCSDAEVAESSARKFQIFGSIDVNYEVNYTPLVSYKPLPLPVLEQDPMDTS